MITFGDARSRFNVSSAMTCFDRSWKKSPASPSYTSSPSAPSFPELSASIAACVSSTAPRLVLTNIAPGLIRSSAAPLIRCLVFAFSGQCRVTMSDAASSCASSTYRTPIATHVAQGTGSEASTVHPNPWPKIFATTRPILPVPITPTVFPNKSKPTSPSSSVAERARGPSGSCGSAPR